MRKLGAVLLSITLLSSCAGDEPVPRAEERDPDWIRLEIPSGREAYAVAGDIEKTLLVSTWTKIYYTTDQGRTWQESRNFNGPVPGLMTRNDTVFALEASGGDAQGDRYASLGQYLTADYGKTWLSYHSYYNGSAYHGAHPVGAVRSRAGAAYRIKRNTTPISPNSASSYVNPSEILREGPSGWQAIRFPFKRNLLNLHLDAGNRLYVAASGGTYQEKDNTFTCCSDGLPAIVYVSRKPLP